MRIWLHHHQQAIRLALRRLAVAPVNALLSLLAIGVVLALPAGSRMLLSNARHLVAGAGSALPQISVFMAGNAERRAATEIEWRLKNHGGVKEVQFVSREDTLARLKASAELRDVIEALPMNPFPDALIVTPTNGRLEALEGLAAEFRKWPAVAHVQLDSAWVRRLDAMLKLGQTAQVLLGALFGAGLIAITFTIIRMQILTCRAEIEVSHLLGASDRYIRRPFLYYGILLGLGGASVALLVVQGAVLWLRTPLAELARLYDFALVLQSLDGTDSALLLGFAAGLGWLGAMISLRRYLRPY